MVRKLLLGLLLLSAGLAACQNEVGELAETPQVVPPSITAAAGENSITATVAIEMPTDTAEAATAQPAAEPTITPPDVPTLTPTYTPIPVSAVESISLKPLLVGAFTRPVYLTHAFDDRLFIVEQAGLVRIIKDDELLNQPFLDIRDRVGSGRLEQGLLSIAFHPNYPDNGRFFVNYTNKSGDTIVSRFAIASENPDSADLGSETVILAIDQPYPNHNGGQIKFGPDGFLYVGMGDGGSANDPLNNGQDPNTLLGTLLRLDVDFALEGYAVPATNPFVGDDTRRNEIWAWGLRNPWRFSFDRLTGDMFIADVGQNVWEEVHVQNGDSQGGENYGWNILEGSHCFIENDCDKTGLELPIFEYDHQGHCSITGGYIYRGQKYPELYGNYFVADYCSGHIWSLIPESDGGWTANTVLDSDHVISSFGEDVDGELYLLDHNQGSIYHLQP
ncbi:MAG: PQQ-dependent sugar dehydrogenase [Candidatus Promineifilaceae bacterium]|nr:PQQ-dependent sugar dehydrogenase [Candidatus Promineifilaceae bacterium]